MAQRRRYTKKTKADAVAVALASSAMSAAEKTGIPRRTIGYWLEQPEFAEVRQKTREDLAEGSKVIAHMALDAIKERLPEFEPRDLVVLYGIMTDKSELLTGGATGRTETRILDGFNDHERDALHDAIAAELAKREKVEDE
jgi:hypothetical protein